MSDPLLELAHDVDSARSWLDDAIETCGNLCVQENGEPTGWTAAEQACDRLDAARKALEAALEPLAEAIREAQAAQDEAEDRWDAQRL